MPGLRVAVDGRCLNTTHLRGIGKYASNLIKAILSADASVEFHVLADEPSAPLHAPNDRRITSRVWEQKGHRLHAWEQVALPLEARRASAILHCLGTWCPLWQPLPVVVTVHDTLPWEEDPCGFYLDDVIPVAFRRATGLITISQNSRKDIVSRWPQLEEKITVIVHGIEQCYFEPAGDFGEFLRAHGVRRPYLLYVGETLHESAWIGPYGFGKVCETLICSLSSAVFRKRVARPGQPD